jgi:hypothetical protein
MTEVGGSVNNTNERAKILPATSEVGKLLKHLVDLETRYPTPTQKSELRDITTIQQSDIDELRKFSDEPTATDIKSIVYNFPFLQGDIDG